MISFLPKDDKEIKFVKVAADRAESFEKRSGTLGKGTHQLFGKVYIRLLPKQGKPADEWEDFEMKGGFEVQVDYLGADLYEYPHCAYYYFGSAEAEAEAE